MRMKEVYYLGKTGPLFRLTQGVKSGNGKNFSRGLMLLKIRGEEHLQFLEVFFDFHLARVGERIQNYQAVDHRIFF